MEETEDLVDTERESAAGTVGYSEAVENVDVVGAVVVVVVVVDIEHCSAGTVDIADIAAAVEYPELCTSGAIGPMEAGDT